MDKKNFFITELKIYEKCANLYRKVLKEETYRFNQLCFDECQGEDELGKNIFGKRVFIQAIVGKNGSGKSSILEIIYRITNNFSYYVLDNSNLRRISAEPVFLIEQVYADICFVIDDLKCAIMVRDKFLGVKYGERKIYFGNLNDDLKDDFEDFEKYDKSKHQIVELASSFFYTIVTNYSFQSLVTGDFSKDIAREFTTSKEHGISSNGNWLDSLFRKNDGYITPIVFNPLRDIGVINLQKEYYLTLSRIAGLLIFTHSKKRNLLNQYEFSTIRYSFNDYHFFNKLFDKYEPLDNSLHRSQVISALGDVGSIAYQIISAYKIIVPVFNEDIEVIPYAYLIYKTLSVLGKYYQHEKYANIPEITQFAEKIARSEMKDLLAGIKDIKNSKSHENVKIHQTLNYLRFYNSEVPEKLNLEEYGPFKGNESFDNINDIIEHLPPPFYEQEIFLLRSGGNKQEISISSLSSGERQFIYTIGTVVYHIRNILSIQQANRIRYRNINLVLDEVEICFHPEYQRQFIHNLLELLKRLNLTRNCSFNILIVTHSPFILSDIPKDNILYLKDGKQYSDGQLINPFAANINDILYQSFFLEGGFMGEYATSLIRSAIAEMEKIIDKRKSTKNSKWNEVTLRKLIDMIGEPLLRDSLLGLYSQAFKEKSYEELLQEKDKEIKQLRQLLKEGKNI